MVGLVRVGVGFVVASALFAGCGSSAVNDTKGNGGAETGGTGATGGTGSTGGVATGGVGGGTGGSAGSDGGSGVAGASGASGASGSGGDASADVVVDDAPTTDVTDTDAGAFDPTAIPGCVLWLRGDKGVTAPVGNKVTQWADQSGLGHHVASVTGVEPTLGAPVTLGNQPALLFDQSLETTLRNFSDNPVGTGQPRTVILIGQSLGGPGGAYFTFRTGKTATMGIGAYLHRNSAANYYVHTDGLTTNHEILPATTFSLVQNPFISVATTYGSAVWMQLRLNGSALTVTPPAAPIAADDGLNGFIVGNRPDVAGEGWHGWIAEVIVFTPPPQLPDVQAIEAYAAQRYGLLL